MQKAAARERWAHTASLMALFANINRDPKKHPEAFSPSDFHPFAGKKEHIQQIKGLSILKSVFVKGKKHVKG